MDKLFNMDNKFFSFMGRAADLFMLNVVFVICCLPVVTIGASLTALHYVTLKMARNEESYIIRSFFKSFKQNFKQATGMWMLFLVAFFILSVDIWFWMTQWKATGNALAKPFLFVSVVLLTLAVMTFIYTFADLSCDCVVFLLRYHYFNHRVCGDWIRCGWLSVGVHYAQMLQAIPAGRRPACT